MRGKKMTENAQGSSSSRHVNVGMNQGFRSESWGVEGQMSIP